jgi:transposase
MSYFEEHVDIITDGGRRRRWPAAEKLRIVAESFEPGETVSSVARRNRVAPNLLFRWRKLMSDGGAIAVSSDESVVGNSEVKHLKRQVQELERLLGRKTMETEILKEALDKASQKKRMSRLPLLPNGGGQ